MYLCVASRAAPVERKRWQTMDSSGGKEIEIDSKRPRVRGTFRRHRWAYNIPIGDGCCFLSFFLYLSLFDSTDWYVVMFVSRCAQRIGGAHRMRTQRAAHNMGGKSAGKEKSRWNVALTRMRTRSRQHTSKPIRHSWTRRPRAISSARRMWSTRRIILHSHLIVFFFYLLYLYLFLFSFSFPSFSRFPCLYATRVLRRRRLARFLPILESFLNILFIYMFDRDSFYEPTYRLCV